MEMITLPYKQFTRLVGTLAGLAGYPDPDNPLPPGPWDPVIREALRGIDVLAGPHPTPWRRAGDVMLNPQPLPPREVWALVAAQAIVADIQRTSESLRMFPDEFQYRAVEMTQAGLAELVDDWCGTGWPRRWPIPWPWPPEPDPDPRELANPLDLIIIGAVFDRLSGMLDESLQGAVEETAVAFIEAGVARM